MSTGETISAPVIDLTRLMREDWRRDQGEPTLCLRAASQAWQPLYRLGVCESDFVVVGASADDWTSKFWLALTWTLPLEAGS